jgi:hypothetical protein
MPARSTRVSLAIALCAFAACGEGFLPATLVMTLQTARARWQRSGIDSYAITVHRLCFCGFVDPVRVTVEDGAIVSRIIVATGEPLPARDAPYYPDVPGLFAIIESASGADDLRTEFDATYGFPTVISIDWKVNLADDEVAYRTEAFRVQP